MYIAIDLKSFYASVECVERKLNPLLTNLVVADASRTDKTICLAVSPSLKTHGIAGRARLFEVVQKIKEVNAERVYLSPQKRFIGESYDYKELADNPSLKISYITAKPRMALYMEYSTRIYEIYLKYIAPEDIHIYSIDEVFIDVSNYLNTYKLSARELAMKMINEVYVKTGITATAGIGTNIYLCKVAMDIVAKHCEADEKGVRIAELDEISYRKTLWTHKPLTDFWRVGRGYAKKLNECGLMTMGDIARCSMGKKSDYYNEDLLYKLFGINAELLIDHAWGWEPCTMADIKAYKPNSNSISTGQVLPCPYTYDKARLIVKEMTDLLVLDMVEKGVVTNQMVLNVGYDIENLTRPEVYSNYKGEITTDGYGRKIPKQAHASINLDSHTSSTKRIIDAILKLFDDIVDKRLTIRRMNVVANNIVHEESVINKEKFEQLDLFIDYESIAREREEEKRVLEREKKLQRASIEIKKKYGKNAIVKGMNLEEGATTMLRNNQIGGHNA